MITYFSELCRAMETLAADSHSVFLGQAVACEGTGMSKSFANVPREKLIELPVFENTQLGMSVGLSLAGFLPVSVFPRWNFLVAAADQLVNHLDKLPAYSAYKPRVIIRVASGNPSPLNPGPQHLGDFGPAFKLMLRTVRVVQLFTTATVYPSYYDALRFGGSTILVEYPALYERELS